MLSFFVWRRRKETVGITRTIHSFHHPGFGKGMAFANCRFWVSFFSQGVFPFCVTQYGAPEVPVRSCFVLSLHWR